MMLFACTLPGGQFELRDRFGRTVNERGIVLVDWEGQLANPAVELHLTPPPEAGPFPTTATLTANSRRIYFDLPSRMAPEGPVKVVTFATATSSVPVRVAIFPDRDGADESYDLTVRMNSTPLTNHFPLRVVDQDVARSVEFPVVVDFSQDRTGFFADERRRKIVEQAAADWAYFLADMNTDIVRAGDEATFIWETNGFQHGNWVTNPSDYRGFLFYAHGICGEERRSGGAASAHAFQRTVQGELPLRRSGSYQAEVRGNYNALGWFLTRSDDDWSVTGNLMHEPNDLYSIAHHEVGHALFFNPAHTRFAEFKARGAVDAPKVVAYHGAPLPVDGEDHLTEMVDRLSGRGGFGGEYSETMPAGRWLITKLDLLVAESLGYRLRDTSAFRPLTVDCPKLPTGKVGQRYEYTLPVRGGIPSYDFQVVAGALPAGITLDRFTGSLQGTPLVVGPHEWMVRVAGQDAVSPGVEVRLRFEVQPNSEPAQVTPAWAEASGRGNSSEQRIHPAGESHGPVLQSGLAPIRELLR